MKDIKKETITGDEIAVYVCKGCDYWSRPLREFDIGILVSRTCPDCNIEMDLAIGRYQWHPEERTWYGRIKAKKEYINFIRKPIDVNTDTALVMSVELPSTDTSTSFREELSFPEIGDISVIEVPDADRIEPTIGGNLKSLLDEYAVGTETVGEELRAQDREDELFHPDIPAEKVGVHSSHCCIVHGCKYGNRKCPVVLGEVKQEYLCEECDVMEGWTSLSEVETHVREQSNGMLPYISAENFEKLYGKDTAMAGTGEIYENCAKYQDRIAEEATANLSDNNEFENSLTQRQLASIEKYRLMHSPTVLDRLHFIEEMRIIYDIHYCKAGVGIIFYDAARDKGDYRSGLIVDRYYDNFEDCIIHEAKKISDEFVAVIMGKDK